MAHQAFPPVPECVRLHTPNTGGITMEEEDQPAPGEWRVVNDPRFWVQPYPLADGAIMSLRDPQFGWIHFQIPAAECLRLAELLKQHSAAATSGMTTQ